MNALSHKAILCVMVPKISTIALVAMLAFSALFFSVRPAAAQGGAVAAELMCIQTNPWPGAKAVCTAMASGAISEAVGTAILVFVRSMITRMEIAIGLRAREASMNVDLRTTAGELTAETEARQGYNPAAPLSCAADSQAAILNGRADVLQREEGAGTPAAPPVPSGGVRTGPVPRVTIIANPGPGVSRNAQEQHMAREAHRAVMERARGESGEGAALDITTQRALEAGGCRPCTGTPEQCAELEASGARLCPLPFADVDAMSLFMNDTFLGSTPEAREAAGTAALMYCVNLMAPGAVDRVGGAVSADSIMRQAVERTGDARTSLAVKVCTDAWARRTPIGVPTNNPGYALVVNAACAYRGAMASVLENASASVANAPAAPAASAAAGAAAAPAPAGEITTAQAMIDALSQGCTGSTDDAVMLSSLELTRIITSDIFTDESMIAMRSGASDADLIRALMAMETINAHMNMETLRMQELLNMLQAANLASEIRTR